MSNFDPYSKSTEPREDIFATNPKAVYKNINLGTALKTLMDSVFQNYSGCIIETAGTTFKVGSRTFMSLQAAKDFIDTKYYLVEGRSVTKEQYEEYQKTLQ